MRRAIVFLWLAVIVSTTACRDYAHFEKHTTYDASAQVDGGADGGPPSDGGMATDGGPDDGGMLGCVDPLLSDLNANPAPALNEKEPYPVGFAPARVVLVSFVGSSGRHSALGFLPGNSTTGGLTRVDDIDDDTIATKPTTATNLPEGGSSFAAERVPGGDVHMIVVCDTMTGCGGNAIHEYTWGSGILKEEISLMPGYRPMSVTFGDVTGDGVPDLLVGAVTGPMAGVVSSSVQIFAGQVGKQFLDSVPVEVPLAMSFGAPSLVTVFPNKQTKKSFIAVLDPAGGGTSTLALLTGSSAHFDVVPLQTTATYVDMFGAESLYHTSYATTMTAADVDHDGQDDLVLGGDEYAGTTTPTKRLITLTTLTTMGAANVTAGVTGVVAGLQRIDWNRDGADDLFFWTRAEVPSHPVYASVFQQRGGGQFELSTPTGMSRPESVYPAIASPAALSCPPRLVFSDTEKPRISILEP
ncbi:MAG: FG-GAP and VCBS repeat-containing protein [Polyangia bacterium]